MAWSGAVPSIWKIVLLSATAATALSTRNSWSSPLVLQHQHSPAGSPLRLRGGVMWVGGGRQFNRTCDPSASYEDGEDTFQPLRERLERADRIQKLIAKFGPKYRSTELVLLEEEAKYLIRAQQMIRARSLSVDLTAAGNFQRYVVGDLELSKHRVGIMYGRVEDGHVFCDVIYEPPQDGNQDSYKLLPDPDEANVERVASLLGLRKVGFVFTARPRKCIFSSEDVYLSCEQHSKAEKEHGFDFARSLVSAIITRNETTGSVVFEAYQVSDLCTDMFAKGVLNKPRNPNKSYSRTSEDVLVERKPAQKVDNDFFINTVPIKTHDAPLFSKREAEFNVENRPGCNQNALEVKHILVCHKTLPVHQQSSEQLRDFHMLLYLSKKLSGFTDMSEICKAILESTDPSQDHQAAIRSLADVK